MIVTLREPSLVTWALFSPAIVAFWVRSIPLALVALGVVILWLAIGLFVAWLRPDSVREKQRKAGMPSTGKLSGEQYYMRIVLIGLASHTAWEFFRIL